MDQEKLIQFELTFKSVTTYQKVFLVFSQYLDNRKKCVAHRAALSLLCKIPFEGEVFEAVLAEDFVYADRDRVGQVEGT